MEKGLFALLDGEFIEADKPMFNINNRAFRYGDSVFESIRVIKGKGKFLNDHLERLKRGMGILGYEERDDLSIEKVESAIASILKKNNIDGDGRLRFTVFRTDGGYYTPLSNETSCLLEVSPLDFTGYTINPNGLKVDIFQEDRKYPTKLSSIKSGNAMLYVQAASFKREHKLDDCIILNHEGNIIEAISSNIFAVKNGVLYTPPIEEGCVDGVMRKQILKTAFRNKVAVYEIELRMNVLMNSDELFLSNAINGIQWIGKYKNKSYGNSMSKLLIEKLNESVEEQELV